MNQDARKNAVTNMGTPKAMTIANLNVLPAPLESETETEAHGRVATWQRQVTRAGTKNESEKRLWKVCAEGSSPWPSRLEWIGLLFLVVLATAALACCLSELFYFLDSGK
ncbi:MAG TPA: hypothetical protein VE860_09205 [Chthoniobacterales bacterium]|jgi:hypothetical protein|nr:hypothetical protein [Chthoniobacterales bacterium]